MNNPKVSILLATYNPKEDWLILLLRSLNNQNYRNLELIVRDDGSSNEKFNMLNKILKSEITQMPFFVHRNRHNIGSNRTFGRLMHDSSAPYIAFCDQDDIWHSDKISKELYTLKYKNKKMVCSDVRVIDASGKIKSKSITHYRKRFNLHPNSQTQYLIYKNFVIGCTVLIDRAFALGALPVSNIMNHDHDLAIYASNLNQLVVCDEALVDYRIHSFNQSGVLGNVFDKKTYYKFNIDKFHNWVRFLSKRYKILNVHLAIKWSQARIANFNKEKGSRRLLWKTGKVNKFTTLFEMFILHRKLLFKIFIYLLKRNII